MTTRSLAICLFTGIAICSSAFGQGEPSRVLIPRDIVDAVEEQELRWPMAVAATEDRIAAGDAFGERLLLFRRSGVSWMLADEVELSSAPIAVVRSGDAWVVATRGGSSLQAFDDAGRPGLSIELPGGFVPGAMAAVRGGDLLVYDVARSEIARIGPNGTIRRRVPVGGYVTALASEGEGAFFAAVGDQAAVLQFGADGTLVSTWDVPEARPLRAWPSGLAIEPGGRVFVADRLGNRIVALDRQGRWVGIGGRKGWDPGHLRRPSGLAWSPGGELVVAEIDNGRLQIFRLRSDAGGS